MGLFLDTAKIEVHAGKGGDGAVAFRREKYVPDGGPAGGDGGRGGDILFEVDEGLATLMDFKYHRIFRAKPGEKGMNKGMHGRGADNLLIKVPQGTTIKDGETGEVLVDLIEKDQVFTVAKGGRGGRGNIRFATGRNPAPEIAENGEPGEEKILDLELRILADVGIVGFPSVGKSTLLSVISNAKPKTGAYHFTTIQPNIGMVQLGYGDSFVVADMPGLIKGAHSGAGLGIEFLRHIERTRVLLHLLDMSSLEGRDPYEDYLAINQELESYDLRLMERPQIIVANKMDMPGSEEQLNDFKKKMGRTDVQIFEISALTKSGLSSLLHAISALLETTPEFPLNEDQEVKPDEAYYGFQEVPLDFQVSRNFEGKWQVTGKRIEKLATMTNFDHEESSMRFARQMRKMGIDEALRQRGAKDGDQVQIGQLEFEFVD